MLPKTRVLLVDDDINLLNAAKRILRKEIDLETAQGGAEALRTLETNGDFAVVVCDHNMPDIKGAALLSKLSQRWPSTVRVMLTGNDDQNTAINAVNTGQVFRFIRKPCGPDDLLGVIKDAAQHHQILAAEKQLLEQTLSGSVKLLSNVLSLVKPEIFRRAKMVQKWAKLIAQQFGIERALELDLAAMFYPLGMITLPDQLIEKYLSGRSLSPDEQTAIDHSAQIAAELVGNIPRLKTVSKIILFSRKGYDGSGFPQAAIQGDALPQQARILRILIDFAETVTIPQRTISDGLDRLKKQRHLYDTTLFEKIIPLLLKQSDLEISSSLVSKKLLPQQLQEGDITVENILDTTGRLLLAAKEELSTVMIKRLQNMYELKLLSGFVQIRRKEAS